VVPASDPNALSLNRRVDIVVLSDASAEAAELLPGLDDIARRRAAELRARHDQLLAELGRHLPDWHAPSARGGQTLWVRLPHGDGASFAQMALRHGVSVLPGSGLDASGLSIEYVRLHYCLEPGRLTDAVRGLRTAWQAYDPPTRPSLSRAAMVV
jgi:DNA-binding transcriptional MocR family regulator